MMIVEHNSFEKTPYITSCALLAQLTEWIDFERNRSPRYHQVTILGTFWTIIYSYVTD